MKRVGFLLVAIALSSIVGLVSCDKIDQPFEKQTFFDSLLCGNLALTFDTVTNDYQQNVLIEDFTGQYCGNCPGAAVIAHDIAKEHEGRVFVAAVHAGFYADPFPAGSPYYTADYRTESSTEYHEFFGLDTKGNPNGTVNRVKQSGDHVQAPINWKSITESLLTQTPEVGMQATAVLDTATNSLCVSVFCKALTNISGSRSMTVYLLEDSIVGDQNNYSAPNGDPNYEVGHISNYVHSHMLRDNINGTWGETWLQDGASSGDFQVFNYTYEIQDTTWRKNHLEIVAYTFESNPSSDVYPRINQAIKAKISVK